MQNKNRLFRNVSSKQKCKMRRLPSPADYFVLLLQSKVYAVDYDIIIGGKPRRLHSHVFALAGNLESSRKSTSGRDGHGWLYRRRSRTADDV